MEAGGALFFAVRAQYPGLQCQVLPKPVLYRKRGGMDR